jgi:hypothetical protein
MVAWIVGSIHDLYELSKFSFGSQIYNVLYNGLPTLIFSSNYPF